MSLILVNVDDPFFRQVVATLAKDGAQVSAVFTVNPAACAGMLSADVECIDTRGLYRLGDVARTLSAEPAIVCEQEMVDLAEAERLFLIISDRTTYFPTSLRERRRVFRDLVRYLRGWLAARPHLTTLFFDSSPHMGWDLVLYFVARRMGLRTLVLSRTLLAERVVLLDDFREPPCGPGDFQVSPEELAARIEPSLMALVGGANAWTEASSRKNAAVFQRAPGLGRRLRRTAMDIVDRLAYAAGRGGFNSAIASNTPPSPLLLWREAGLIRRQLRKLRRQYEALAITPDLSAPYVFLALHFQPERTTQPEAGMFEDQFLAAQLLAHALPPGWRLYVKEHPRQFDASYFPLRRRHARDAEDYRQIASLPNTVLVSAATPSQDLIKGARISATLTGSTGWEALTAGKPAVVFGPAWYSGCAACFRVRSLTDARKMLHEAASLDFGAVRQRLLAFLAELAPHLVVSSSGHAFAASSERRYEDLTSSLAAAIRLRISGTRGGLVDTLDA